MPHELAVLFAGEVDYDGNPFPDLTRLPPKPEVIVSRVPTVKAEGAP